MGASLPSQGHGGKRSLDAELNLVPFIDLLCSLISFLLMTAVWMQVSSLELKQGSDPTDTTEQAEPQRQIKVHIHDHGFTLVVSDQPEVAIACTASECVRKEDGVSASGASETRQVSSYDYAQLSSRLKEEKSRFPSQKNVSIVLADGVAYSDMIKTMDTCLDAGLDGISLSGTML
jgi:biopolymer transport protein TolR